MWDTGRLREALDRMDAALGLLAAEEPDADVAALAAQVGRFQFFAGEQEIALERVETALELAETLGLPEVLSQAVNTKAMILSNRGRIGEAGALVRLALDVALEHDITSAALRAYNNVADLEARSDRHEQAAAGYRDGLALARRVGSRAQEWMFVSQTYPLYSLGRWDEALAQAAEVPEEAFSQTRFPFVCSLGNSVAIHCQHGELDAATELIERYAVLRDSSDLTERTSYAWPESMLLLTRDRPADALTVAGAAWDVRHAAGVSSESIKETFAVAVDAALALGDTARAEQLVADVESIRSGTPQSMRAQAMRFRARMAATAGDDERADRLFRGAASLQRELVTPFPMAVVVVEHAEWLAERGRGNEIEPGLAEARAVFERLRAVPWLERAGRVSPIASDAFAT
jgi:tetratricopeptide (TPR) repeat protein